MANITTEDKTSIQIVIPKEAKEYLESIAEQRSLPGKRVYISDLVREALKLAYNGDVNFEVDRGGYRERKPE